MPKMETIFIGRGVAMTPWFTLMQEFKKNLNIQLTNWSEMHKINILAQVLLKTKLWSPEYICSVTKQPAS